MTDMERSLGQQNIKSNTIVFSGCMLRLLRKGLVRLLRIGLAMLLRSVHVFCNVYHTFFTRLMKKN